MAQLHSYWLDRVLAVPIIGIQCNPQYPAAFKLHELATAALHEKAKGEPSFALNAESPLQHTFQLFSGFGIQVTNSGFTVRFSYPPVKNEQRPGKLADVSQLEMRTYSDLLLLAREYVDLIFRIYLEEYKLVEVKRFGIVAQCELDVTAAPAGIQELITHLGSKWNRPLVRIDSTLVAELKKDEAITELCHHTLKLDKNGIANLLAVVLDWQRMFTSKFTVTPKTLSSFLDQCQSMALTHFENVGSGIFNYEQHI